MVEKDVVWSLTTMVLLDVASEYVDPSTVTGPPLAIRAVLETVYCPASLAVKSREMRCLGLLMTSLRDDVVQSRCFKKWSAGMTGIMMVLVMMAETVAD